MTNNDILRRLRFCLDLNDKEMASVFASSKQREASHSQIHGWLKKDDQPEYKSLNDKDFAAFLNGLINQKRGEKPGGPLPLETELNNNIILRKLKIAFNFTSDDMLEILQLANFKFSPHELTALFRKPDHKHFRQCKDQILRNFLIGLQLHLKPSSLGAEQ